MHPRARAAGLIILLLAVALPPAFAADYAREQKWADEIVPGIVVGDVVQLQAQGRQFIGILTEAPSAKVGVVVVHGMGIHPDWGLIGVLRTQLPERGYTTLSVQMPVLANEAKPEDYPSTFPEAAARLAAAVKYLQDKGAKRIAIVSHSMGSRMANAYLTKNPQAPVAAWVAIGLPAFSEPAKLKPPVLDLYGENDFPAVLKGAAQRQQALKNRAGSKQQRVAGADHFFEGQDEVLVKATADFLDSTAVPKP